LTRLARLEEQLRTKVEGARKDAVGNLGDTVNDVAAETENLRSDAKSKMHPPLLEATKRP
jgi:hypothetical protein